jgi:translation initiation factor 1
MNKKPRNRMNVVYSTNKRYSYETNEKNEEATLPPARQQLKVFLDRLGGGKMVSRITGFVGTTPDLEELAKMLKHKCGTGGNSKDGAILIQGDKRNQIIAILSKDGYKIKLAGG